MSRVRWSGENLDPKVFLFGLYSSNEKDVGFFLPHPLDKKGHDFYFCSLNKIETLFPTHAKYSFSLCR